MCQDFVLFVCLRDSIKDLLRHVLRSVQPIMADAETVVRSAGATERFFELVGADIVLDSDLQPFLCEVHTPCPAPPCWPSMWMNPILIAVCSCS